MKSDLCGFHSIPIGQLYVFVSLLIFCLPPTHRLCALRRLEFCLFTTVSLALVQFPTHSGPSINIR